MSIPLPLRSRLPPAATLTAALQRAYDAALPLDWGENANYIPALAEVPDGFGLAIATVDGQVFELGETRREFAIESISKVLTLARVIEERGADELHAKVGAGSTGLPFNSVLAIELHQGKPLSPLVNAGALSTVSLLPGQTEPERWSGLLEWYSRFTQRPLAVLEEVYQSEAATNHHNRGISHLLYSYGTLYADPLETCDLYTRQCSVGIHTRDLAFIGAVLAHGGVHPLCGERLIQAKNVPPILAEMTMEGLYDASGDWAFKVGLPAKSGVGGGIVAVAPGKMALAAYSPRLDPAGNSVRGLIALHTLAGELGLNIFSGD